jgi:hypothetical protein
VLVRLRLFDGFTEFFGDAIVVVVGQCVTGSDDQRDRPVDDLDRGQGRQPTVVGQLIGPRVSGPRRRGVMWRGVFGRPLVASWSWLLQLLGIHGGHARVVSEPTSGTGADPLTGAVTQLLAVPLRELYAVLWRAGVVVIVD